MPAFPADKSLKPVRMLEDASLQTRCVVEEASGQRLLAVRVLPPQQLEGVAHQRMRHQAELLQALPATGVPRLVGLRSESRASWLLFEFVDGWPLRNIHQVVDPLPHGWVLLWTFQLLHTLATLHGLSTPWIHGALTPNDIVVDGARAWIEDLRIPMHAFPELTRLATTDLDPNLVPPEFRQAGGRKRSPASDVYAVAAIAFWMLTRRFPEIRGNAPDGQVVREIQQVHPQFPPAAADVLESMLLFHRDRRCSTAADAMERLALLVPSATELAPLQLPSRVPAAEARPVEPAPMPTPALPVAMETAARPVSGWQETVETVGWRWKYMSHWRQVGSISVGMALVAGLTVMAWSTTHVAASPHLMTCTVGAIDVRQLHAAPEWQTKPWVDVPGCLTVARHPGGRCTLTFGTGSSLVVEDGTEFRCNGMVAGVMRLDLLNGRAEVKLDPSTGAEVTLPGGVVACAPGSQAELSMSATAPHQVTARLGSVDLRAANQVQHLPLGQAVPLPTQAPPRPRQRR